MGRGLVVAGRSSPVGVVSGPRAHRHPPEASGAARQLLTLQRTAGNRAVAGALTVQRDLAVSPSAAKEDHPLIEAALAPLVKAGKVTQHRDGSLVLWGSTVDEAKGEVVAALEAKGFTWAAAMATAVFDPSDVMTWRQGRDPAYGGATIGGEPEEGLERQTDRPLTGAERNAAVTVFWGALRTSGVTISESRVISAGGYARTIPDHIYFPKGSFDRSDFLPWLIHELTHVWQYQRGAPLGNVVVSAMRGNYDYGGEANLRKVWAEGGNFGDFGFEQQGDILQHYFERVQGGRDTSAYDPFVGQVRSGWIDERQPHFPTVEPLPGGTLDVAALNEKYRQEVEAKLLVQLRKELAPTATKAILQRRDEVLRLFGDLRGYWSGTYLERLTARSPRDELVTLLHRRMSDATITKIVELLGGKTPTAKPKTKPKTKAKARG